MEQKKIFWTMGQAAESIGESVSLVRFWANSFPKLLKPARNAKGNRLFTENDMAVLKQLHFLIREKGMTLEGASKQLQGEKSGVEKRVKAIDSLKEIRARLLEIKQAL